MKNLTLLALVAAAACAFAQEETIAVNKETTGPGAMTVAGPGWNLVFDAAKGAPALTAGDQTIRIVPLIDNIPAEEMVSCASVESGAPEEAGALDEAVALDEAKVKTIFRSNGAGNEFAYAITNRGTLRVTPPSATCGVAIQGAFAAGILPGVRLEDVIYLPEKFADTDRVHVPSENWFAGLIQGCGGIAACAWKSEGQSVSLQVNRDGNAPAFSSINITGGGEICIELLAAPDIWHREALKPSYLEKNVEILWRRPFPATYKTQLVVRGETPALRTFTFFKSPNEQYRPEMGAATWPVWFDGERALLRLSKKIPPRGEAVIYPMDGAEKSVMGFVRRTPAAGLIEERNARAQLPHGPHDGANVGFVACGGTKVMRQTIFRLGLQHREREFLREYADFLSDYVAIVQKRNVNFFKFFAQSKQAIDAWLQDPALAADAREYLVKMRERADAAETGLQDKMDLYEGKSPEEHMAYAEKLTRRLQDLLATDGTEMFPECDDIIDKCNRLSWGHAEVAGMRFSMLARDWAQDAALSCANVPAAAGYAREIRASICDAMNGAPPW